jgi:hypothetical protein
MVDAWAEENAALDEAGGLVPVADLFVDAEPARGVLEGTYDVSLTRGARSCTGACDQLTGLNSGTSRQLVYSFRRQCDPSAGCSTAVETQSINTHTGDVIDDTVPLVTDAETFTWGTDQEVPICEWTYDVGTTTLTGRADNRIRWSVSPTAAEMRDGVYVITELEGSTDSYLKIIEHVDSLQFPGCETLEVEWTSGADMKLTRRAS